jgi:hypothetical protein
MKPIFQQNRWVIGALAAVAFGVGLGFLAPWQGNSPGGGIPAVADKPKEPEIAYRELSWRELSTLDLTTGTAPEGLMSLDQQHVKIPGFIVPLDDDAHSYSDFLLLPSAAACIHVPLPPANQMVLVSMQEGNAPERRWTPVWIKGKLKIAPSKNSFGTVSYQLQAVGTEEWIENH